MTKFDFKKWVIEHKHGKQSLNEKVDRDQVIPFKVKPPLPALSPCSNVSGNDLGCESFKECGSTSEYAYHFMNGPASFTNTAFWNWAQQPAIDEVIEIEDNSGNVMFLEYVGITSNPGVPPNPNPPPLFNTGGVDSNNLGDSDDWTFITNHGPTILPATSVQQGCTPPATIVGETWDCANIGWSWEAPIAPHYQCVINTNGTGTFATEMECLDSMCGDLKPKPTHDQEPMDQI